MRRAQPRPRFRGRGFCATGTLYIARGRKSMQKTQIFLRDEKKIAFIKTGGNTACGAGKTEFNPPFCIKAVFGKKIFL